MKYNLMLGETEELQQEKPAGVVRNKYAGGWKCGVKVVHFVSYNRNARIFDKDLHHQ